MASFIFKAALFVVSVVLLQRLMRFAIIMGVHRHMFNHTPGPCRTIPGIDVGSEDITTLSNGVAIITSGVAIIEAEMDTIQGRIFSFDFNQPDKAVKEVKITGSSFNKTALKPVGMSAWEDPQTGKVSLFVVNKPLPPRTQSVELFDYDHKSNTLRHKKTVISDAIFSPNDVIAVSADTFYVTNDMRFGRLGPLEVVLTLPTGTVAYYDGSEAVQVASGLSGANGISKSQDGRYIYVSGLLDAQLNVFERGKDGRGSLLLRKKIDVHTSVDNINVDKAGDLWLGCHYLGYTLDLLTGNRWTGTAQVLRMRLDADLNPDVREVLADDGKLLKGSSVASVYGNKMLVGTITNQMILCDLIAF
ncbi:serum paraoxonase/arylesterase 1-like [Patiria miniata]|uniref:Paraoxonase n=1 Tax=Patiria miniata TaxID=46514 RepID=A0A913Z5K6_PATMI|nr:serum paraoxonase/arylesterase 1-like [Patiria miniata]